MSRYVAPALIKAIRRGKVTRRRACARKHSFTRDKAIRLAASRSRTSGEQLHAYPCAFCEHWHIGHDRRVVATERTDS